MKVKPQQQLDTVEDVKQEEILTLTNHMTMNNVDEKIYTNQRGFFQCDPIEGTNMS